MGTLAVAAERQIDAPADEVYRYIADHRDHHPHFLPPAFSDFKVVSGGVGAGTVATFKLTAGGRTRDFRTTVAEPEPGRVMTESDANSTSVTTWTVAEQPRTAPLCAGGPFHDCQPAPAAPHQAVHQALS